MPRKIPPRPVIIVPIRPEIPFVLRDHLSLPLSLLLVLFNMLILINTVHELTHAPKRFPGQKLPQIVLGGQGDLESPYSYVVKVPIYLIKHLAVPVRIRLQALPLLAWS